MAAAHIADSVDSVVPTINQLVELESDVILWWSFFEVVNLPLFMKKHQMAKLNHFPNQLWKMEATIENVFVSAAYRMKLAKSRGVM